MAGGVRGALPAQASSLGKLQLAQDEAAKASGLSVVYVRGEKLLTVVTRVAACLPNSRPRPHRLCGQTPSGANVQLSASAVSPFPPRRSLGAKGHRSWELY